MESFSGRRPAVQWAVHLIEELGPALGLQVTLGKWELFSMKGNDSFPPPAKRYSLLLILDLLGAPTGDCLHSSKFVAERCTETT